MPLLGLSETNTIGYNTPEGKKGTLHQSAPVNLVVFLVILTSSLDNAKISAAMEGQQYQINRIFTC